MLEHILNSIDFYFYKLASQFEEILSYSYFTNDYHSLIQTLQRLFKKKYSEFLRETEDIRNKTKTNQEYFDKKDYGSASSFYLEFLNAINFFVLNIKNVKNTHFHHGNFILLKEFLSKGSEFIILPFPKESLNYGHVNTYEAFKELVPDLDETEIEEIFQLFFVPHFNQEDIFFNTLLGHELGHYYEKEFNIGSELVDELRSDGLVGVTTIEDIINTEIEKLTEVEKSNSLKKLQVRTRVFEEWKKKLSKWCKEIICDVIWVRTFGIPALLSFFELMFLTNPNSSGDRGHPPTWLRLRFIIAEFLRLFKDQVRNITFEIKKGEIEKIGDKLNQRIDFINKNFPREKSSNHFDKSIINVIYTITVSQKIKKKIDNLCETGKIRMFIYDNYTIGEIQYLMTLLREYITPNEFIEHIEQPDPEPAEIMSILNAGWLFYIYRMQDHYSLFDIEDEKFDNKEEIYERKSEILQKLSHLLLKALELSKIHQKTKKKLEKDICRK